MGIFSTLNDDVNISTINKDKQGAYWQRIDEVLDTKTPKQGLPMLQINKTIVRTLDGVGQPGDDTSHALFRDKFNYLEKELKKFCMAAFDLTLEEANSLTAEKMHELLIKDKAATGSVIEVTVREVPKKNDPEKTFTQVHYKRFVSVEEIKAKLSEAEVERFFPAGL